MFSLRSIGFTNVALHQEKKDIGKEKTILIMSCRCAPEPPLFSVPQHTKGTRWGRCSLKQDEKLLTFLSTIETVWLCQRHFLETNSQPTKHLTANNNGKSIHAALPCSINQFLNPAKNAIRKTKKGQKKRWKLLSRNGELNTSAGFLTSREGEN